MPLIIKQGETIMPAPIALQLYTVRDTLAKDFAAVVSKIAAIGYVGVETAGFPGTTPQQAAALFRELGLAVPSAHIGLPLGDQKNQVLDTMGELGCKRIVSPSPPREANRYKTLDHIRLACDLFNEANVVALANGLTLGIHNHWWEFEQVEGRYVYQLLLEHLEPEVFFQIDTYWVKTAGADPAKVVRELGARAPLLHVKDGPCVKDEPQMAVGGGAMDIPAIVQAAGDTTEWMIVELDQCATDMLEAVEESYRYLVSEDLARGRLD
jgi:sugar phosphate isomerase/epimerase